MACDSAIIYPLVLLARLRRDVYGSQREPDWTTGTSLDGALTLLPDPHHEVEQLATAYDAHWHIFPHTVSAQ